MTEQELYDLLDERGIPYETFHHEAVFTVAEGDAAGVPDLGAHTKNLFLRDDKKRNFYVVTADENQRVDLKALAGRIPSRRLSFAREEQLQEKLGPHGGRRHAPRHPQRRLARGHHGLRRGPARQAHRRAPAREHRHHVYRDGRPRVSPEEHGNPVVFCDLGPADVSEAGSRA